MTDVLALAEEIIKGRRLKREDDASFFLTAEITELQKGADKIREKLCGNQVDLCSIINGRSGRCSEDCKFCAQSGHHCTSIEEYPFLDIETIVSDAKKHEEKGVRRYSIVTAGRSLGKDYEKAKEAYQAIHQACPKLGLCASHGLLSREEFEGLKAAGVTRYHANIETSRRNFPNICTTHTYGDKIEKIKLAKEVGLRVCSGGIIGMGETWEDRIDMAFSLAELEVDSIPINVLSQIPGTPYEKQEPLTEEDILRTVAIFRYINPTALVRIAAGRFRFPDGGRVLFESGINATITGDMLTTVGNTIEEDLKMFADMNLSV
ncbi:MAG: biotin synthase BioB [Lachnospiraceae bacterium]|nr:biotin synthase BioB [Lachnospiraceae bacterium]